MRGFEESTGSEKLSFRFDLNECMTLLQYAIFRIYRNNMLSTLLRKPKPEF